MNSREFEVLTGRAAGEIVREMFKDDPVVRALEQGGCGEGGRCPAADRIQMSYVRLFKKGYSRPMATAQDLKGFSFKEFLDER